jgi:hypothetical protein
MNKMTACGALAVAMVASAGATRASDGVFMKDLLGSVGIIPEDKPPIAYRERAPLVLPPKASLPTPVAPARQRNAEWPKDPEVVAQKRRESAERVPITEDERYRMLQGNPRLSVDELRAGRRAGVGIPTEPATRVNDNNSRDVLLVHPDVLRGQRQAVDGEGDARDPRTEPKRKALTEPPSGFRMPSDRAVMRNDFEPTLRPDEADPIGYIRQQNNR